MPYEGYKILLWEPDSLLRAVTKKYSINLDLLFPISKVRYIALYLDTAVPFTNGYVKIWIRVTMQPRV